MLNLNFPSGKMSECVLNDTAFSCTWSGVARWNRANILSRFCHFTVQLALCKLSTAAPAGPLKPQRLICQVVWRRTRGTPGESAWSLSQGWIHPRSCLPGARRAGMGLRGSPNPGRWQYSASSLGLWGENMRIAIYAEKGHPFKTSVLGFCNNACKILAQNNGKWHIKYERYKASFVQVWSRDHQEVKGLGHWSLCKSPGSTWIY